MRTHAAIALVVLLGAVAVTPSAAQEWAGQARLRGEVEDEAGKPVEGAQVLLRRNVESIDPANPGPGPDPVVTDRKGRWVVAGLATGPWHVLIVKDGYAGTTGQVQIGAGVQGSPLRATLQSLAGQPSAGHAEAAALIQKGNQLLTESQYAAARAAYEGALALLETEHHPAVLRGVARTQFQEEQVDAALATLDKALAIAPEDPETLQLKISLLVAAGREAEAAPLMERLPAEADIDPTVLLNLGIARYNEGKMEEAFAQFDRVVQRHPELPEAYYFRGLAQLSLGKTAEARADFEKLIAMAPDHARAAEAREFLKSM